MAFLFDKETFEGGSPGTFDSVGTIWGDATATLDTTSKVNGSNSIIFANTGEGGAAAVKSLGADRSEIYLQIHGFIPTGFAFGASNFCGLISIFDSGDNSRIYANIENWGTVRLTFGGDVSYTNTGVDLPVNSVFKLEIYIKKNATTGSIKVWLNNNTEGSPDYSSGDVNTGAGTMRKYQFGKSYVPESMSSYYLDDISMTDTFLGAGTVATNSGFFAIM
jgi:hypothetical protein